MARDCPQLDKCGSCVMWSPRQHAATGRNDGVCLLERDARKYLDCNARSCPYYRPRRESPAFQEFQAPRRPAQQQRASRARPLGREAPAPSPAALAMKALEGLEHGGALSELALELVAGKEALPPLLERFRGGSAVLKQADGVTITVPAERWFLWICGVKRALDQLEQAVGHSALGGEEKEKILKDIKAMYGTMTTFNLLFRNKEDHFVGQKQA